MRAAALILLCWTLRAWAQQPAYGVLEGVVRTASGEPLPGANVLLEGTLWGAAARADGSFRIERVPAGRYTVRVSMVGYETYQRLVEIRPGEVVRLEVQLRERVYQSPDVVVTATRREQRLLEAPISVSLLALRDLEARNALKLDEALRYVPGVYLTENQINIRGSSGFSYGVGSRVAVLFDGIALQALDRGETSFDAFPLDQVERIEVVKGAGSALYGSSALGGVVNLITRTPSDAPQTTARLYVGAYEPVRYAEWKQAWPGARRFRFFSGLVLGHSHRPRPEFGYWASLTVQRDEGFRKDNDEFRLRAYGRLTGRWGPRWKWDLYGSAIRSQARTFYFWDNARNALVYETDRATGGNNHNRTVQSSLIPVLTWLPNARTFHLLRLRYYFNWVTPLNSPDPARRDSNATRLHVLGFDEQSTWQPERLGTLTAGLSGEVGFVRSGFYRGQEGLRFRTQPNLAAFLQWELPELGPALKPTFGIRLDWYPTGELTYTRLSPKASLVWTASTALALRASYGHGFRVPSIAERYVKDEGFLPLAPNPRLRPERSLSWELGARWTPAPWLQADLAGFWNVYRDLIEARFQRGLAGLRGGAFQFQNVTQARIRGLEAELEASPRTWLRTRLGYTYMDPVDRSGPIEQALAFRSRHLLLWTLEAESKPWSLGMDFRYQSKMERVDAEFARFVEDVQVIVPIRVLDLRLGYGRGPWTMNLIVRNALEYYYVERPALLAPPRNYVVQVRLRR
ncbi:MAG: TonB-dependent receptor [Bacteroidetes bacterium]|nr:TonB-dependent receptor [Rhodothermia bacterium]MCX7907241.1 TonB-dependent receptor [Bacteroidota bacterium]MDW8286115.1 TonB-dependent receptor [Bacteroidota bacterium]